MEEARKGYARQMARKALKEACIINPPVDVMVILDIKGYHYIELDTFMDGVDALFVECDGLIYAAVNANHHLHRQRFSIAHELGHILLGHNLNYYNEDISLDNPPSEQRHTATEKAFETEAN